VGCNIRESTAGEVHIGRVILLRLGADVLVQVSANGDFLVPWSLEVVAETAGRTNPGDLGVEAHGSADTGNVWACGLDKILACARKGAVTWSIPGR
jgi:hypothetical protein